MPYEKSVVVPLSADETLAVCQLALRGVAEADYHDATICTEFDVSQLTDHLIGSVTSLGGAAGAEFSPATGTTLEERVAAPAQAALEAWNARGADGTVKLGPNEVPATLPLGILSIEFLVHAWDYAQATGQQIGVSDELTGHVLDVARTIITAEVRGGGGFAEPRRGGPGRSHPGPPDRLHRPRRIAMHHTA